MAAHDPAGDGARGAVPRHSYNSMLLPDHRRGGDADPAPAAVGEVHERVELLEIGDGIQAKAASGVGAPMPADGFEAAGYAEAVHQSAVQSYAMPEAMAASNLAACAETGTVKTDAFGILLEVSGKGALAPAVAFEGAGMADSALRVKAASGVGAPTPADGFEASAFAEAVRPSAVQRYAAAMAASNLAACTETGPVKTHSFGILVEVSGKGKGALAPVGGLEGAGMADPALQNRALFVHESPMPVQRSSTLLVNADDIVPCVQVGLRKTTALGLPVVRGLLAATTRPLRLLLTAFGEVWAQIKLSRKCQECNPRSEAFPIGAERTKENQHSSTGTCKTYRQGYGSSCHINSSWRIWILALFVLLSACTNSVAGMSCSPDVNICPAESVRYVNNSPSESVQYDKFCPVEGFQYKRVKREEFSVESNLPMCKESECRETEKKETECKEKSIDVFVARTAAGFTFIANLGPMVPIMNADQVSPDRRRMLCMTSVYLAASSCSWIIYLGPEDCINWSSYYSLTAALLLHSFYGWFFRQENHGIISVPSLFTLLGSSFLAIGISLLASTEFMKIGTRSDYAKSTPAAAAGILGPFLTCLVIWYKRRSKSEQIDRHTCINILCAFVGTTMFICCIHWLEKGKINPDIISFKIGIAMTNLYQLYEVVELIWFYIISWFQEDIPGDNNEPLLQPDNGNGH